MVAKEDLFTSNTEHMSPVIFHPEYLELSPVILVWVVERCDHNSVWELSPTEGLLCFLAVDDRIEFQKYLQIQRCV